jgi:nitrate reductase molybdenum cofactor assembly chaperone NarJ/NarW
MTALSPEDPAVTDVILMAASVVLDYPGPASGEDLELVAAALAGLPSTPARGHLEQFVAWWRTLSQTEREQFYVATFDMGGVSLHLTERWRRTSQERGTALLALRRAYRRSGAGMVGNELPDYLPLMLEAAAHLNSCFALLARRQDVITALWVGLETRHNPFAAVLAATLDVLPWAPAAPPPRPAAPA